MLEQMIVIESQVESVPSEPESERKEVEFVDTTVLKSTGPSTDKKDDSPPAYQLDLSQINVEYKQLDMTSFKADSFRLIILANPGSGIYSGRKFLAMLQPGEQRKVKVAEDLPCTVEIFDLTMALNQAAASLEAAIENRSANEHILVALMGGDGSVSRNVNCLLEKSEIVRENIDMVGFVMLPFGTGNDCSRSMGWGARDTGQAWAKSIASIAEACCSQKYDRLALWDVEVFGETYMVQQTERGNFTHKLAHEPGHNLTKPLACYFNLGLDAKVTWSAEMHERARMRCCSDLRYGKYLCEFAMCWSRNPRMSDMLASIDLVKEEEQHEVRIASQNSIIPEEDFSAQKKLPSSLLSDRLKNLLPTGCFDRKHKDEVERESVLTDE